MKISGELDIDLIFEVIENCNFNSMFETGENVFYIFFSKTITLKIYYLPILILLSAAT